MKKFGSSKCIGNPPNPPHSDNSISGRKGKGGKVNYMEPMACEFEFLTLRGRNKGPEEQVDRVQTQGSHLRRHSEFGPKLTRVLIRET
jgi:hypothetical protein